MKLKILICTSIAALSALAQINVPTIAPNLSTTTISIIRNAAEQNDAEALCKLGDYYRKAPDQIIEGQKLARDFEPHIEPKPSEPIWAPPIAD
jgi:hypothetical protein